MAHMEDGDTEQVRTVTRYPEALTTRDRKLDPFPWYREMRETAPIRYDETQNCWDVFRHAQVSTMLADHERFTVNNTSPIDVINQSDAALDYEIGPSLLNSDPPEHTRIRRAVASYFTPQALDEQIG